MHTPGRTGRATVVVRRVVLLAGELALTAGVVVLLYAAYLLFWTNVRADAAAAAEVSALQRAWADPTPARMATGRDSRSRATLRNPAGRPSADPGRTPVGSEPPRARSATQAASSRSAPAPVEQPPGDAFALLRIPRLGSDWVQPVVEGSGGGAGGISEQDLASGVVHYPGTALPGRVGNMAIAGHRATNGEPFADLDRVVAGDRVVVETRSGPLAYTVTSTQVVTPDRLDVLAPVPGRPGEVADRPWLTLTTCHPRWASTSRLVVYAVRTQGDR